MLPSSNVNLIAGKWRLLFCSILVAELPYYGKTIPPNSMKAAVLNTFGPPDIFRIEDLPIPTISEGQILVKVKAAGINPVDAYIRSGSYHSKPLLPAVLGKEIAGYVEATHPTITYFREGDRVFCGVDLGGYAEYAAANATSCYHLDERLSFSQGAALFITYFTSHRALISRGRVRKHDGVLIHGASGIVGTSAIQVAKHAGAFVVGSVTDSGFEKLAKQAGADEVVYHNHPNYLPDILSKIKRHGFDAIVEILAELDLERDKTFLAPYGRIVVIGNRVNIDEAGRGTVYTVSMFRWNQREQKLAATFVLDAISQGNITPIVDKEFRLEDVSEPHREVTNLITPKGKYVLVF